MSCHDKSDSLRDVAIDVLSVDRKLDEIFEQYKSEIMGTIYFLYAGSESMSKIAYEKLRKRCSRCYENSRIGNPHAWVFRILYNLAFETVGNSKTKRRKNPGTAHEKESSEIKSDEEAMILTRRKILRDALLNLRFSERAVFLLRQNGGLSYEQIARATGFSEADVRAQMKTAIDALVRASDSFSNGVQKQSVSDSEPNEVKE